MSEAAIDLVLLPGLLCDNALWAPQLQAMRDVARVTVADLTRQDSISGMATDVLAKAPPRFAVAGLSMGGRVALEIYRQAPHRVTHLALLNTGYSPPQPDEVAPRQAMVDRARQEGLDAIVDDWIAPMIAPGRLTDAALVGAIRAMVARMTPETHARQIAALLSRPNGEGVLTTITCPTLVLAGREDRWAPPERHKVMAELIGTATLLVLERCGHFSTLECAEAVSTALREWLVPVTPERSSDQAGKAA